jgi:hypothetical protein
MASKVDVKDNSDMTSLYASYAIGDAKVSAMTVDRDYDADVTGLASNTVEGFQLKSLIHKYSEHITLPIMMEPDALPPVDTHLPGNDIPSILNCLTVFRSYNQTVSEGPH